MENKQVKLLTFLIKTESKKCPPENLFPVNEERLLALAGRNKAIPFVFHFLDCPSCKKRLTKKTIKKLPQYQKPLLLWPLLYRKEKQALGKFCRKERIKIVLLKDFSSYPKMKFHHEYLMGTDLDILVKEKDLGKIESFLKKTGYKLREHLKLKDSQGKLYYQEKTFIHPKRHINLDLHTQLAIPHKDEFHFLEKKTINQITKTLFQNALPVGKQSLLCRPNKEYFLFSLITHCLASDLLKGLRNLFDIIQFASLYDKEINWKKFLSLTKRFKITNFSYFILLLGSQIFALPFPQGLRKNIQIPFRVRLLVSYWSVEKIALFPPIEQWAIKNKETKRIFYENFFIKMFLFNSVSFWRLIRPRVFLFISRIGLIWFSKAASRLYRKFPLSKSNQHQLPEAE
ncbi:nucleotidyltransferase family protein [Patescibacteria group bacterium]|nr:nucleotidyltransferase family protein [Patescibacteria group bacterium]